MNDGKDPIKDAARRGTANSQQRRRRETKYFVRTLLLDGWGIHMGILGGWVWNLWGRDCVVIYYKNGDNLRIRTDDTNNLVNFLRSKGSE